ncbi:23S rRNA (adenine(1618)-N(6))-methyltransferase RlmF [Orbus mooreae]|uniref:23S rRNA (adenine(1618)-N(6))-methyltransferase RlmF n=1 Tax=Orbus mooreae TaxID=3074107 RepID=UPI00370D85F9
MTTTAIVKAQLHPRNLHRDGYNFEQLISVLPKLANYVCQNAYGNLSIDFANPDAVKMLNKALLLRFYHLDYWDIPEQYLCPPVSGRADYIHYLADLLAEDLDGEIPRGKTVRVLDIGVGANAIYPIIGQAEYGWSFVGSDINPTSIKIATMIAEMNSILKGKLVCRLQKESTAIFTGIIKANERYALTLCNPPFHASAEDALHSSSSKLKNLAKHSGKNIATQLNFGGQHNELWCEGGEVLFVNNMIEESVQYGQQCLWFTSLISKKESLAAIMSKLEQVAATAVKIVPMAQGQKVSRFVAWSFLTVAQRQSFLVK